TERVSFSFNTETGYYSQPNVLVPGTNISQQGDYFASATTLGMLVQWLPRFSTVTSYTFSPIFYVEESLNDNLGRIQQTVSQSFNFLVKPTTTAVVEYRISPTTYFKADLNSLDQYALVGFNHIFNPRMTWNARVGAQFNILQNPVDGQTYYFGPYGETAFAYNYGEVSKLSFTLRYGTEASGLQNVTQRQSLRTGLGITHGITKKLVASGGVFYGVNYYDQGDVIDSYFENILELTAGLEFELNRFLSFNTGYRFTGVLSPENPDGQYTRDIVFVGLTSKF
ncbi:MAG: outer membrane beta-barrel protein, partial [Chthoniobacterales bacterium]|nr:outer membrane beta-barrel protein [Chthoniobacterales bacterium]